MKRIFFGFLALIVFVSSGLASYTYFISENLYTPDWSHWAVASWLTLTPTMTPYWYSAGGYGGIGQGSNGIMTSGTTPNGEVRLTIRTAGYTDPDTGLPAPATGQFDALFGAGTNSSGATCAAYRVFVWVYGTSAVIQLYGIVDINYTFSPPYPTYATLASSGWVGFSERLTSSRRTKRSAHFCICEQLAGDVLHR